MTDFRALCVNLVDCLEKSDWPVRYRHVFEQWIYIARKALAEPEPEEPTSKELHDLWLELYAFQEGGPTSGDVCEIARIVLDRWGSKCHNSLR